MTIKRPIHTTLFPTTIAKLERYGNGTLNVGIEKVLEIAESKQYNVKSELVKIAEHILSEDV